MIRKLPFLLALPLLALLMNGCRPVKHLGENAVLLNKNIIKSDNPKLNEGAAAIIKQKPNRKILGIFRFHLGMYTIANQGKETKFKRWVKSAIGEEPVLLNQELTAKSTEQLQQYLENSGYFNGKVTDTTVSAGKQKANVIYTIQSGIPYTIRNIRITSADPSIGSIVKQDTASSHLKPGRNFSTTSFQMERDRITGLLRDHGYYDFNQQYIKFDIDSSIKNNQVDVYVRLAGPNGSYSDTTGRHKKYSIDNIYIQTDYNPLEQTLKVPTDTSQFKDYTILTTGGKSKYKPEALSRRIYIEKDQLYSSADANYTYSGLLGLGVFRFVNIKYEPSGTDSTGQGKLDSYILLTPSNRQEYKVELEGTYNGGNFGIGGNLIYTNKNIFNGAELLEVKFKAKVESVPNFTDTISDGSKTLSLNTYELGPEINLRIPGMLWPLHGMNRIRSAKPITNFKALYNYTLRPEYEQYLATLSAGFEYNESKRKKHLIYPAEINLSRFDLTQAFINKLITSEDPELLRYYESYLITNGRYSFIYNAQQPGLFKDFIYFRFNFEIAGNSLRLIDALTEPDYSRDSSNYEVFGTKYSQYVRPDFDARYYQIFDEHSSIVYRLTAGFGYTYLNSDYIPYEKAFFAGGSNDLRAFRTGTVGPGSYNDTQNFEQFGSIKINSNVEYRFDIFKILEGAFFVDAGNIWLMQEVAERPGGQFKANTFLEEFAIGAGAGLRFDFSFFIFRIDGAAPVRDPSRPIDDRWTISGLQMSDIQYNFGIGYPF